MPKISHRSTLFKKKKWILERTHKNGTCQDASAGGCEAVINPERSQKQVDMSPPCMCSHNFIPWEEKRFSWPVSTHRCILIHLTKRRCALARARGLGCRWCVSGWMMKDLIGMSWSLRREECQAINAILLRLIILCSFCSWNDPHFFWLSHAPSHARERRAFSATTRTRAHILVPHPSWFFSPLQPSDKPS